MKKILVSCDDLGISEGINSAIKKCSEKGVISSTSIVANGNFYEHALNNVINKIPIENYGLHLNLTEGKALFRDKTNDLTDKNNHFKFSAKILFFKNFFDQKKELKIAVYNELKTQIEKVIKDGIKLSHFDSHEHIHHSPWIFKIIEDLGKEFNIKKIRFVNEKLVIKNYFKDIFYKSKNLNYLKHLIINFNKKKIKNSFISTDYFFGLLNSGKIKSDELFLYLDSIEENKITEICFHPSDEIDEKKENLKSFYSHENRKLEKNFLLGTEFKSYIQNNKIRLTSFSEIN